MNGFMVLVGGVVWECVQVVFGEEGRLRSTVAVNVLVAIASMLLLTVVADLFLPLPWAKILKDFENPTTLFTTVYGSCTKVTSMLF